MKKLFFVLACFYSIYSTAQQQNTLYASIGFNSVKIGTSPTIAIKELGTVYTVKEIPTDDGKVIELQYNALGISFEYNDSIQKITNIWLTKPCTYKTDKGIQLDKSIVTDVIAAYGAPQLNLSSSNESGIIYEGIIFYFTNIPNVRYYKQPEMYNNSIITKIEIKNNAADFVEVEVY